MNLSYFASNLNARNSTLNPEPETSCTSHPLQSYPEVLNTVEKSDLVFRISWKMLLLRAWRL